MVHTWRVSELLDGWVGLIGGKSALTTSAIHMELSSHIASTKALFAQHFGGDCTVVVAAPGRVNLIGEHTDYNEVRACRRSPARREAQSVTDETRPLHLPSPRALSRMRG